MMKNYKTLFFLSTLILFALLLISCGECEHAFGEWQITKSATCSEVGEKERTCNACQEKQTEQIPALGHSYSEYKITTAPTCNTSGIEESVCSNDSEHTLSRIIEKTGHNYESGICTFCGEQEFPSTVWDISKSSKSSAKSTLTQLSSSVYTLDISGAGETADFSDGTQPWSDFSDKITALTIGNEITSIGKGLFENLSSIESLTIPSSILSIEEGAFANCKKLIEINFESTNISSSSQAAFSNCGADSEGITVNISNTVTQIPSFLFFSTEDHSPNITSVLFEEDSRCEAIGEHAFQNLKNLKSMALPDSVTQIGAYAFFKCISVSDINLGENLFSIGAFSFSECSAITTLIIPKKVETINESAFSFCTSLTKLTLCDGVKKIEANAFAECSSLSEIDLGNTVSEICDDAFLNCTSLQSITLPDSLVTFSLRSFNGCSVTQTIGGITYLDRWIVSCDKYVINAINIEETTVGFLENAFKDCKDIKKIFIPSTLKYIKQNAFESDVELNEIYFKGTKDEWQLITVESGNGALNTATVYYYLKYDPMNNRPYWHYMDGKITPWGGWSSFEAPTIPLFPDRTSLPIGKPY